MPMESAGGKTMVARLTHARLFGTDSPYEDRSPEELAGEMRQIQRQYAEQDEHYLFEQNGKALQLVICSQGDETVRAE